MPELKIKRIMLDQEGNTISEQLYATKIAVITDSSAETTEVVRVDLVRISAMMIDELRKSFQANFVIGGLDSKGNFHASPQHHPALMTTSRQEFPDWWDATIAGRTVYDFDDVLRWIHEGGGVKKAGENIWEMPDLVSYYEGEPPVQLPESPPIAAEKQLGVIPPATPPPRPSADQPPVMPMPNV